VGVEFGFLVSPAGLITAAVLTLTVMTGLAARIALLLEDTTHRQLPPRNPHRRDNQPAATLTYRHIQSGGCAGYRAIQRVDLGVGFRVDAIPRLIGMASIDEHRTGELLDGPHQGVLSVSRREKGPVAVPMSYLFIEGRFFMVTPPESLHGRVMKRTGRATITVQFEATDGRTVHQWYVMAEGQIGFTAQYLGKLIPVEVWATSNSAFRVSANTAGVSRTASVSHPVFDTAFEGAAAFGVGAFSPETTASLNGLLAIRDWLEPRHGPTGSNDSAKAKAVTSTRVHGGIYNLPYPLDSALRVAAGLGAARHPGRIVSILRR
jgi:hypothetical protein